jgi:hypothetical protein
MRCRVYGAVIGQVYIIWQYGIGHARNIIYAHAHEYGNLGGFGKFTDTSQFSSQRGKWNTVFIS